MAVDSIAEMLLAQLPQDVRERIDAQPRLEQALNDVLDEAARRWPGISLAPEEFLPFLGERLAMEPDPLSALATLRISDLYIACACLHGDAVATERFQTVYLPQIELALRQVDPDRSLTDDVKQMVYVKVFAPEEGEARISRYSGRGDFGKWLQVVAVRLTQNLIRRRVKEQQVGYSSVERIASPEENQELRYIKRRYHQDLEAAFQTAFATLSSRQRNILRYRLLERMSLDEMAALFHVHRSTITRWIAAIRKQLLEETRRGLGGKLNLPDAEVNSIMQVLRSQVDVSVRQLLG